MKLSRKQHEYLESQKYKEDLANSVSKIKSRVHQSDNEDTIASIFENEVYLFLESKIGVEDKQKKEFTQQDFGFEFSGRIDMMDGGLLVEYKRPSVLTSQSSQGKATEQVLAYYQQIKEKDIDISLMLVTDGKKVSEVVENIDGIKSSPFKELDVHSFDRIIKAIIASDSKRLNSYNIVRDFSLDMGNSITKRIAHKLFSFLNDSDNNDRTDMIQREWQELFHLSEADTGKNQDIVKRREELGELFNTIINNPKLEYKGLFALQTTYAIIVKLMACKILHRVTTTEDIQYFSDLTTVTNEQMHQFLSKMEDGYSFADEGIRNLLEGDFFSWYVWEEKWDFELYSLIKELVTMIEDYTIYGSENHLKSADVFKDLYIEIMPKAVRHSLGEYFTPAWLADSLIKEAVSHNQPDDFVAVDPTCGSGIFLITIIQNIIAKHNIKDYTDEQKEELLSQILERVKGVDINPLSVLTARVGYMLAISPLLTGNNVFEIPVYLGDSAVTPQKELVEDVECFKYDMASIQSDINAIFPVKVVENKEEFSQLITFLAKLAKKGNEELLFEYLNESVIRNVGKTNTQLELRMRDMIDQIIALNENGWNGLWVKVIGNFIKMATINNVDVVIGNPPWVKWEFLPSTYAERIKAISISRHLFSGQNYMGAISLNICALIAHVTATTWLKTTGVLAFLMPKTILTQDSYEGFRNFIIDETTDERFYLQKCVDWEKSGHPFIDMKESFLSYIYKRDYVDYSKGLPLEFITKKRGKESKNMRIINLEHSFEKVKNNFEFTQGKLVQVDNSRSGFTFVKDAKQVENFSKIIGYCAYKGRSGVEFTPKEVYMLKEGKNDSTSNKLGWTFNNDVARGTIHKVNQIGPLKIETEFVRPLIKGPMIGKFCIDWSNEYVIYPYRENQNKSVELKDLLKSSPKLTQYLLKQESVIGAQSERSKAIAKGDDFYSLSKIGAYTYAPFKVVFRDNSKWAAAVLGPKVTSWGEVQNPIPAKHAPYISQRRPFPNEKIKSQEELYISENEAYYICGILNSPVVENYILSTFSHRSISIDLKIKLPLYDENNPLHREISEIAKSTSLLDKVSNTILSKLNELYLKICDEDS